MTREAPVILVVDDEASAQVLMRAALRKAGFEVTAVSSGAQALEEFRNGRFDLVMLDVDMPGISGYEVCTRLREQAGALLPIVMVTGLDDLASVERAYESGATDFIAKPVHWAALGHRVRYLLRGARAMRELQAAQEHQAAILEALPDLLFEVDLDGRYLGYHSPNLQLLAAPPEAFLGRTVGEVLPAEAARVCMAAVHAAHANGHSNGLQIELPLAGGARWFELSVARKRGREDETPRFIVLSRDITDRKDAEAKMARLAYFDDLTGLPNRASFLERLERELRRARIDGHRLCVLFMDLDGFKQVNDTLGHRFGDQLLRSAADRLREALRPSDMVSRAGLDTPEAGLARLGGDEFTALIPDIERAEDALVVAQRIGEMMRRPFQVEDHVLALSASLGVALFPDHGTDVQTLLIRADIAMYRAKALGRDNAQLFGFPGDERSPAATQR